MNKRSPSSANNGIALSIALFIAIVVGALLWTPSQSQTLTNTTQNFYDHWDLLAQWTMAVFAFVLTVLTALGLVISRIGLTLISRTLKANYWLIKETRKASKAAQDGVRAAMDANAIMQETATAQLRAYLAVDLSLAKPVQGSSFTEGRLVLKNTGQTPAKVTGVYFRGDIFPLGQPGKMDIGSVERDTFYVHSHQETTYGIVEFVDPEATEVNDSHECAYFWGIIEYETLGKPFYTKFRFNTEYINGRTYHRTCNNGNEAA